MGELTLWPALHILTGSMRHGHGVLGFTEYSNRERKKESEMEPETAACLRTMDLRSVARKRKVSSH